MMPIEMERDVDYVDLGGNSINFAFYKLSVNQWVLMSIKQAEILARQGGRQKRRQREIAYVT